MKIPSPGKLMLGHLNINSVRNKSEALKYIIDNNIDLLLISEVKLDEFFLYPNSKLKISVFHIDLPETEKVVDFYICSPGYTV